MSDDGIEMKVRAWFTHCHYCELLATHIVKLYQSETELAERRAAADDELMAAALRGEPFWGAGKAPVVPEQIVGLGDFVPDARPLAIERYVRGQLEIGYDVDDPHHPLLDGPVFGHLELGLHYADGEKPSEHRSRLLELAKEACGAVLGDRYDAHLAAWQDRRENPSVLDEDIADTLTRDLDARIVATFGDRPRFIEVWRGDVEDEPLTQFYAPHGMPRWR